MEEIKRILQKADLLTACEDNWKEFSRGKLFSAKDRSTVYGKIINGEIKRIKSSGCFNFHYTSADEELDDLQKVLGLLDENANCLYDSDID